CFCDGAARPDDSATGRGRCAGRVFAYAAGLRLVEAATVEQALRAADGGRVVWLIARLETGERGAGVELARRGANAAVQAAARAAARAGAARDCSSASVGCRTAILTSGARGSRSADALCPVAHLARRARSARNHAAAPVGRRSARLARV